MATIGKRGGRGRVTKARVEADWEEAFRVQEDMRANCSEWHAMRRSAQRKAKGWGQAMYVVHTQDGFALRSFPAHREDEVTVAGFESYTGNPIYC